MIAHNHILILVVFGLGVFSPCLNAQSPEQALSANNESIFKQAVRFIQTNKNDTALAILQPVLDQLALQGLTDTPFGLKLQLAKGQALVQNHRHEKAIKLFNNLKEKCEASHQWKTYAGTCLAMADLYEKMYREDRSRENIELARSAIESQDLDSLYPSLLISYAFWHRNFGYPDSVLYYSREAVKYIETIEDNPVSKYSLAILKGEMLEEQDYQGAVAGYMKAVEIAKLIKDYVRLGTAWNIVSQMKLRNYDFSNALKYNDSTIMACYQAIAEGHDRIYTLGDAYSFRGQIFLTMGQPDSALYYSNKGYAQKLNFIRQQEFERVAEADARFLDEKKTKQLEDQVQVIRLEKQKGKLLLAIFAISLLFSAGLIILLAKNKRAARKLAAQNSLIQQQSEQLKSLDAAKSRFFANVSHELRTPLTLLLGPVKTLLKGNDSPQRQEQLLNLILQSGKQLQQLVDEILDLQKMEMGKMELNMSPVELCSFFNQFISQFESLAVSGQIDFSYETSIEKGVTALLDREKCRQILHNLLSNAFKFTPAGERITTRLSLAGNSLTLEVADTGIGIHPDELHHVFNRFFQSARPDKTAQGGTGIGLALCYEYAKLFGGTIEVKSDERKGSTFRVTFPVELVDNTKSAVGRSTSSILNPKPDDPVITDVAEFAKKRLPHLAASRVAKPTILVVEDNPQLQDYIRLILEEKYHIVSAENGLAALSIMDGEERMIHESLEKTFIAPYSSLITPDLILSDLMMPFMDGYQLLEILKSQDATRHIPVIMLTARTEARDRLKALRIGVDDYLTKPFDEEELLVRIENLLVNQAVRQQAGSKEVQSAKIPDFSREDGEWLENFEDYIQANFTKDTLTVSFLAQKFAMSESTLLRRLTLLTGLSPKEYLQELRLDTARQLLDNRTFRSVSQVASAAGFANARTFARRFRERFGKSPSEYIND